MFSVLNSSGAQKIAGNSLGDWVVKAVDTSYHADTDGFVVGYVETSGTSDTTCFLRVGPNNPGSANTDRSRATVNSAGQAQSFFSPVKAGDYWEVVSGSLQSHNIYWIPMV